MPGLTPLGTIHTLISLVALAAGFAALFRHRHISWSSTGGKVYVWATILTCLTGFGIFQHGGFGKPHALGIITLAVMAVAMGADLRSWFGKRARYVATAAYSMTFFFHFIPGVTETGIRLPAGKPLFASPEAPELQVIAAVLFVVYLAGATWQVWDLKGKPAIAGDAEDERSLPR
jgi:uncharacterized membrane protein